jgi:hypothetical protein
VIAEPYNDRECLGVITQHARERAASPDVQAIARRFPTTAQLAAWIRSLPHRSDDGDPVDGPKVACDVPQRLRVPTRDPNCVERSALFAAAAENIDPGGVYALATIDTEQGRHTFPVENGRPVVLDPDKPRNALIAGLDLIHEAATGRPRGLTLSEALGWAFAIAEEPAAEYAVGVEVLGDAGVTAGAVLAGELIDREGLASLLWVLALAEREEARWWPARVGAIRRVVEVLAERVRGLLVDPDAGCGCGPAELRDGWRIEWAPRRWARAVERAAEPAARIARPLVKPAIKATLAAYGIPPGLVDVADQGIDEIRGNRARPTADSARKNAATNPTTSEDA